MKWMIKGPFPFLLPKPNYLRFPLHTSFMLDLEPHIPILTVIVVFVRRIARVNSVLFSALWTTAPILVSIISFWVYVMRGNELSVSVAFTVRSPLSFHPPIFFSYTFWTVFLLARDRGPESLLLSIHCSFLASFVTDVETHSCSFICI